MPTSEIILGSQTVTPALLMAPMMDVTNQAFRSLIRKYGGCGLFFTEMLNARRVPQENMDSPLWKGLDVEKDVVVQLLGDDPQTILRAVERLLPMDPFGFDLNLGCAKSKIMHWGWGAELISKPSQVATILAPLRRKIAKSLTVKIRFPDDMTIEGFKPFLAMLENEGIDGVIVHARTPSDGFKRPARWERIREIKRNIRIPVIGNGDVFSAADAFEMTRLTECDGVMIGRGAVMRPFIFSEISAQMAGNPMPIHTPAEVLEDMLTLLGETINTPKGAKEFKTFCQYFAKSLPVPHWFWAPLQSVFDGHELARRARLFFKGKENR